MERRTRRGKAFYGCSRYPACSFGIWDRPMKQACPSCGSPILVQKRTKAKGEFLQCPKCKTRVEHESPCVAREQAELHGLGSHDRWAHKA